MSTENDCSPGAQSDTDTTDKGVSPLDDSSGSENKLSE